MLTRLVKTMIIVPMLVSFNAVVAQNDPINHWETIIYANHSWKYFVGNSEPNANWRKLTFDDSAWLSGMGGIGYGDDDDNTIIAPTLSLYLRIKFRIFDLNKIAAAILHIDYDDAFVAFINDIEIARANIGTEGDHPAFDQTASSLHEALMYQGGKPDGFFINIRQKPCLLQGDNVLAIQVHNENIGSSDLSSTTFLSVAINDGTTSYLPTPSWFTPPISSLSSNLPIVIIDTNGQTILDDPRIIADMGIIDNGSGRINQLTDPYNHYDGKISIEIRGSTSQMFPKKCYGLETQDGNGANLNVSLLGMPPENDWILYAPYSDKSLMRNVLTFKLGNDLGRWAPRTRFCELVLNDQYQGVYVLMEKIKRDKNRVNISRLTDTDIMGDDVTGGYIVKIDKVVGSGGSGWNSPFLPYEGAWQTIYFQYHYPEADVIAPEQKIYIQDFITKFETALIGPSFTDSTLGYPHYIDTASFIDYLIVNEVSKNIDAYRLSAFLSKDKDSKGGKIHMGPLWDFNLAFGNADYCDGSLTEGFALDFNSVCAGDYWQIPFWWDRLLQDTLFCNLLRCRWEQVRTGPFKTDIIIEYLDSLASSLDQAQQRNFDQWPILGRYIWPNNFIGQTYYDEIEYLMRWIEDRLDWLDANMPGTCSGTAPVAKTAAIETFNLASYPNPFFTSITIQYQLSDFNNVSIKIYNIIGQEVKDLVNKKQAAGHYRVIWDGTNRQGQRVVNGVYFYAFVLDDKIVSKRKIIKYD